MGRWQRSRQLASSSWGVLKQDKELMVLPLISGIACLIIAATFLVPIFVSAHSTNSLGNDTTKLGPLQYLLFFLMYVVLAYVTVFFKTALLCGADERMRGGNPTIASALSGAGKHARAILPWAILSATVSIILRAIEERSGLLGRIVIGIIGMAWTVVTFLVLPVLVFENVGVGDAVKRSTQMLKQTWGENLIVNGGIGLIGFLLMLPAFALVAIGFAADGGTGLGIAVTVSIGVLWIVVVTCWSNAMTSIFQLALYRYATEGQAPVAFAGADLGSAFGQRSRRNSSFGF
ncbi:MAG: hypothetical protein JWM89_687 [Acidimicrobiales bacterium]|nr:hypothetical protein [Acidimicrobiales bacterium]